MEYVSGQVRVHLAHPGDPEACLLSGLLVREVDQATTCITEPHHVEDDLLGLVRILAAGVLSNGLDLTPCVGNGVLVLGLNEVLHGPLDGHAIAVRDVVHDGSTMFSQHHDQDAGDVRVPPVVEGDAHESRLIHEALNRGDGVREHLLLFQRADVVLVCRVLGLAGSKALLFELLVYLHGVAEGEELISQSLMVTLQ